MGLPGLIVVWLCLEAFKVKFLARQFFVPAGVPDA